MSTYGVMGLCGFNVYCIPTARWRSWLIREKLGEIGKSYHKLKQQYLEEISDAECGEAVQSYNDILFFAAKVYTPESDFIGG